MLKTVYRLKSSMVSTMIKLRSQRMVLNLVKTRLERVALISKVTAAMTLACMVVTAVAVKSSADWKTMHSRDTMGS